MPSLASMKYFFTSLVLIATLCGVSMVHAQAATACSSVNDTNYKDCCGANHFVNDAQCSDYEKINSSCGTITADNRDICCGLINGTGDQNACFQFQNQQQIKNIPGQTGTVALPADILSTTPELPFYSTNEIVIPGDSNSSSCKVIKFDSILGIINWIKCYIVTAIIPIIFGLTFVVFMWGVVKFMRASEKKDRDESKQYITAGLIGLFVMASVWGIVGVLTKTFGFSSTVPVLQTKKVTQ